MSENTRPWVFCGRMERHTAHGHTCPGTGDCSSRETHEAHLVVDGSLAPYWCFGMRIRLYREKHATNDGRKLLNTHWDDEPLPVTALVQSDDVYPRVVGMITEVRREATGWVTGLLVMNTKAIQPSGLAAEATFDQLLQEPEVVGDVIVMEGARFRGIQLGTGPTWDEMVIP